MSEFVKLFPGNLFAINDDHDNKVKNTGTGQIIIRIQSWIRISRGSTTLTVKSSNYGLLFIVLVWVKSRRLENLSDYMYTIVKALGEVTSLPGE